jgi:peptidoglycan/xylan/chitin deacetylase (PgdA/CDA1 family)
MEGLAKNDLSSQIILFHDGPKNRNKTVKVIEALVPALVGLGCEFVRVDAIL